ncbi:hypothetical protein [Catenuloplanes atrovinosus]|uniref:Uncharacterized protein n=1 Tax=Catenuloplanes atrovinosus TaxID=137266 RepID=A0AAE4C9H6_9ACTN|nr:hypothetical protein [Catenuloplanes atrovinosus]MDR7273600.1 hypothetical protein [Catenuloplanes atrovinosus]
MRTSPAQPVPGSSNPVSLIERFALLGGESITWVIDEMAAFSTTAGDKETQELFSELLRDLRTVT